MTGEKSMLPQIQELSDFAQREAQTLHLPDKCQSSDTIAAMQAESARCDVWEAREDLFRMRGDTHSVLPMLTMSPSVQNDQSWVSAAAAVLDAATLATWSIETNDTEAARTCVQTGTRALLATADALGRTRSATEPGGTGPSREKYEVARARLCSSGMRLDSSRPGIPNGTSSSACVSNMRMLCSSWHVELSRRLDDILGDQVES